MKDKQKSYFVNIGSSSLLVIFLILCLVTFAILSLSSARSDYSFSERLAEHKEEYYEASERAEMIVAEIDAVLAGNAADIDSSGLAGSVGEESGSGIFSEYLSRLNEALNGIQADGISVQLEESEGEYSVSFRVPAGEQQVLLVALRITDYREHANYYEVKTWKIVNNENWESEQPLNLMPVIQ